MTRIKKIKENAVSILSKCCAEAAFISLLNCGTFCTFYIAVILAGKLTGAHTADSFLPVFSSYPPAFIAAALLLMLTAYLSVTPLYFGIRWFFWQASGGNIMPLSSLFACYSSSETVLRCLKIKIVTDMRKLTLLLIFCGMGYIEVTLGKRLQEYSGESKAAEMAVILGCVVMGICMIILFFVFNLKYIPVGYLLAGNPDSEPEEILSESAAMVNKKKGFMLSFYLSFAGWLALCLLVFPILFVAPYMSMVTALMIRENVSESEAQKACEEEVRSSPEREETLIG